MKKFTLVLAVAATILAGMVSCKSDKDDYMKFVGDWGVRTSTYYNTDYAGNPIPATVNTYYFVPGDKIDGIDLVFRTNKTGMMIDRSKDTLFIRVSATQIDTIIAPDTVIVRNFTYTYDKDTELLYLNMEYARTYSMRIENFSDTAFTYYNLYDIDYMEKARMVRLTDNPTRNAVKGKKSSYVPWKPGSLLSL